MMKTVLFVCTSCHRGGSAGEDAAGMWFDEFADACRVFHDAGYRVATASPVGGGIPIAPGSGFSDAAAPGDPLLRSSTPLERIDPHAFEALFYPGGPGPMWDLVNDNCNAMLLGAVFACGKVVGAVCHGPAALLRSRRRDGYPVIHERRMTGISDAEALSEGMEPHLPFSLEHRLRSGGAYYSRREPGVEYVVTDGNLVTGQNHASAGATAAMMVELMHPAEIARRKIRA